VKSRVQLQRWALQDGGPPHFLWSEVRLPGERAVHEELDRTGGQANRADGVPAREGVDVQAVVRDFRVEDLGCRCETAHLHNLCVSADIDRVVAVGCIDDDTVGLAVARGAAEGAGEVDVHAADVGSGQAVDRDDVGAAESVEVDPLDAGGVHRDVAGVTEELEAASVRRHIDLLGCRGTVEHHRVGTGLALDDVAAVTGIPDKGVIAGAQPGQVVAPVAVDRILPVPAKKRLDALAAGDRVVPSAAVDRCRDRVGEGAVDFVDAYGVVAGSGIDGDLGNLAAIEAEVGVAVVADVDLEDAGRACLQAKRDLLALLGALDDQDTVRELRPLELGRVRLRLRRRGSCRA
jgi:hypothetical protein